MKKLLIMIFVFILILAFALVACNNDDKPIKRTSDNHVPVVDDDKNGDDCLAIPDIMGEILKLDDEGGVSVLVDSTTDSVKGEVWVSIDDETTFIDGKDGNKIEVSDIVAFFVVGDDVAIISDGNIMESYPMQTTARCVYKDYSVK